MAGFNFSSPSSAKEAIAIQNELRDKVIIDDKYDPPLTIAGLDVGYDPAAGEAKAALVVMQYDDLQIIEEITATAKTDFPYIPGLLSFREIPAIQKIFEMIDTRPDMIIVDGQGIAHPRRLGIASHIGVLLDIPTIGVAKKKLCGAHDDLSLTRSSKTALMHHGERIGTVYRSRDNVKPIYISPGHRIGNDNAVLIVKNMLRGYKLPEPTRLADKLSKYSKEKLLV